MQKTLRMLLRVFILGLAITITLVAIQLLLFANEQAFLLYMPPIGFALYVFVIIGVQPIVLGVVNIILLHRLYHCEGWQIGFWLNGFFLLLLFSTINLLIQTIWSVHFSLSVGIAEVFLLALPFGFLGRLSNRGVVTRLQKPQNDLG